MRALLDINVIIALLDPDHVFHEHAHEWWAANSEGGWASCPLTENGVVRIMANPIYSAKTQFAPGELIERLREFAENSDHEFWPDDISLRDAKVFAVDRILSSRLITDIYLLALATKHKGRMVTFDQGISLSAVKEAKGTNLCVA
jgi:toxin-antitoxin system PIN domain toxin